MSQRKPDIKTVSLGWCSPKGCSPLQWGKCILVVGAGWGWESDALPARGIWQGPGMLVKMLRKPYSYLEAGRCPGEGVLLGRGSCWSPLGSWEPSNPRLGKTVFLVAGHCL